MRALCVFSGGLDSMLAAQVIRAQGIEVLALFFETPFFTSERARKSAKSIDLPLKVIDITELHLKMLRDPEHGFGQNMNPCIDCHILMCRVAGQMLEQEGASFVITGEVLGQRPMSQNRKALMIVAQGSGIKDFLLRPLSAKHLPITTPEKCGWVDREKLFSFQGRSRKPQMALAKDMGITKYPSPAGGCLLTEEVFSRRLKDLFASKKYIAPNEIELLKLGRHFRIGSKTKLVVGRNKKENILIQQLADEEDLILACVSIPGPTVLLAGQFDPEILKQAAGLTAAYSDAPTSDSISIKIQGKGEEIFLPVEVPDKAAFRKYMI